MIADAILDYIFVLVYALLGTLIANHIVHLIRYRKKYQKNCSDDIHGIVLFSILTIVVIIIQFIFFNAHLYLS